MKKIILVILTLAPCTIFAQTTFSWRNDQNPGNNAGWENTSPYYFWNGAGAIPGGNEILSFDGNQGTTMTNNLTATSRHRVEFGSTNATSRTINGSTTNVFYDYSGAVPAIYNNSGVTHNINFPFQIGNTNGSSSPGYGFEINAYSGNLNIGSSISAQNGTGTKVLVLMSHNGSGGSGAINITGNITNGSGTISILKNNGNTATLSGANSYSGSTSINAGTIIASSTTAMGNASNITIANGATLEINESLTVGSLTVNSGGTLTIASGKTLTVNGTLTVDNSINIGTGILRIGPSGTITTGSSFSNSLLIITSGTGTLQKDFTSTGSFLYPVGTSGEYTPVTLNFTSLSGSSYAGVRSVSSAHGSFVGGTPSDYLDRYWVLSEGGFTSFSCNISCVYVDADVIGTTESNIYAGKWNGSSWSLGSQTNSSTNTLTFNSATSLSDIAGAPTASLPVTLINLSSFLNKQSQAELSWSTASELNASHFSIHRSDNGVDKREVGVVAAQGNSNEIVEYNFIDAEPINGNAFYFLEQVDFDGKTQWYGPVKAVSAQQTNIQAFFKENNQLQINTNSTLYTRARLMSLDGKVMACMVISPDIEIVTVPGIKNGMYLLELSNATNSTVVKLIK